MRENTYTGIILKKQPLGEADELITLYTKELGKVRLLAKSVKSSKSKLQQKLQTLFLVEARVAGGKLPKLTGVETIKTFIALREDLSAVNSAFYAAELVLKFSPDEQKNEHFFSALENFLDFLNSGVEPQLLNFGLAHFKLEVLVAAGFEVHFPKQPFDQAQLFFSPMAGGFSLTAGGRRVSKEVGDLFLQLKTLPLSGLPADAAGVRALPELQGLLSELIEFHLERKVKAEKYLPEL